MKRRMLSGEVNVARVDVTANRELGTRFEIKGFPTLKFLSKGKVYDYNGKRTADDIVEFARGGYKIQQPQDIQPAMGMFGEIIAVFKHAYKQAALDLKAGNFFTIDVFLSFMPLVFLGFVILIMVIPAPEPYKPPAPARRSTREAETHAGDAAPATSERDGPSKKED